MAKHNDRSNRSFRRNRQRKEAREERERADAVAAPDRGPQVYFHIGDTAYRFDQLIHDQFGDEDAECLELLLDKADKAVISTNHGNKIFEEATGDIYFSLHPGYELGKLLFLHENWDSISVDNRKRIQKQYSVHEIKGFVNDRRVLAYDANTINILKDSNGRGNFRYIFDKDTKEYLGLAKHNGSGSNYHWANGN